MLHFAQVLFPVDVNILFRDVVGEFVINHGISAVYTGVGLFYMHSECVLVDRHAECKSRNLALYMENATRQS